MTDLKKAAAILIPCILLLFTFSTCWADYEEIETENFTVSEKGLLTLKTDIGSIEINTSAGENVDIKIVKNVNTGSERRAKRELDRFRVHYEHNGTDVNIDADYERKSFSFFSWFRKKLKVKYIITVPKNYNLNLATSGGSIKVSDLKGSVNVRTSGGSLRFGNIDGPITGKTSGGSISLSESTGDVKINTSGGSIKIGKVDGIIDAHTSGGSIKIEECSAAISAYTSGGSIKVNDIHGPLDAKTSGGSVTARFTQQPESDCRLKTSGGSINVYLADHLRFNIDAGTSGGRVKTDLPLTIEGSIKSTKILGTLNGGGPLLYLKTSGGNVNLNRL